VADPAAANPPVSVTVDLTVWPPGDFDNVVNVDQTDFGCPGLLLWKRIIRQLRPVLTRSWTQMET
jgi:hypothetical protein